MADLAGRRIIISIEVDEGKKLAEGLIKTLTGGDTVKARHLYKEGFEFRPEFKLWLCANHAPTIKDDDEAMWRRVLRIPFDNVIPKGERDPKVKATLRDPQIAGPAILAWLVEGCLEWQRDGLGVPPVVTTATEAYRKEMNPLEGFIEQCCELSPTGWVPARRLRSQYEAWAKENGERELVTGKDWGAKLRAYGCREERQYIEVKPGVKKVLRGWLGIALVDLLTQSGDLTPFDTKLGKLEPVSSHESNSLNSMSNDVKNADDVKNIPKQESLDFYDGDVRPEEEF